MGVAYTAVALSIGTVDAIIQCFEVYRLCVEYTTILIIEHHYNSENPCVEFRDNSCIVEYTVQ